MKTVTLTLMLLVTMGVSVFAQGTSINTTGASPDPSAALDVDFSNKGVLIPRLTSVQRDAISAPANGLLIYNTDEACINYYQGGSWYTLCGLCTPQPSAANAGPDQSLAVSPTNLAATPPGSGTGTWSVITGDGNESFGNVNSATSSFSGTAGYTYSLEWAVTNGCGTNRDTVQIEMSAPFKYVFATSTTSTGGYGGLSGADNVCQARADAAGLPGSYVAWLSNPATHAKDRITDQSSERKMPNGVTVANNLAQMLSGGGGLSVPLNKDEYGNTISSTIAYTGTGADGNLHYYNAHCNDWTSNGGPPYCCGSGWQVSYAKAGDLQYTDTQWTDYNGTNMAECNGSLRLICFQN